MEEKENTSQDPFDDDSCVKELVFSDIVDSTKKMAVTSFYHLLVLATRDFVQVNQNEPFDKIKIRKARKFHQDM
jgi:chromatin segregation and condensation protein Rec8/ScpA/Scc1 (kleisin family)